MDAAIDILLQNGVMTKVPEQTVSGSDEQDHTGEESFSIFSSDMN